MGNHASKYRWIVFISVLLTYLFMSSQRTAPGLITDQLMLDFGVSASTIGFVTGIQFFVYTSMQIPMGILADRYGPNFFLISGALLTGLGTILYSIGSHEFILIFARILTGIGDATIWVNLVLIMGHWFNAKEFTRLIGVAGMTGSLGFLVATAPFSMWIGILGWRGAFFSLGFLLCFLGIVLYILLVKKPKQPLFIKKTVKREKTMDMMRRIFSSRQAWALFLCHFGLVGGYIGFIGSWAVPYGMEIYGMTRLAASHMLMISLIGALIGAPLIGWISSRIGKIKQPYMIFYLTTFVLWSTFLFFRGEPPLYFVYILFFLIGFNFGANSLTFAVVRMSFPKSESGIVSGFANTGGFLSAVLLPVIYCSIIDYFQHSIHQAYYYAFFIPVIFCLIGLIGVSAIKEKQWERVNEKS